MNTAMDLNRLVSSNYLHSTRAAERCESIGAGRFCDVSIWFREKHRLPRASDKLRKFVR